MKVTVVDRAHMDATYGQPGFAGVALRTVEISNRCPQCGGPRGAPAKNRYHEWGEFYYADNWTNPCGHLDKYSDVLKETDPIMLANERQSQFFAENPRDEEITRKPGWDERWELLLDALEGEE